jgi:parvulin-like peptidyl-prolyl isomerase
MTRTPKRIARLAVAVVFVVPAVVVVAGSASVAAPTKAEVEAAQAEANRIGHELEIAIEQYNDARVRLQGVQDRLADALDDKEAAEAIAAEAMGQLEDRAVEAYTGAGSQMDVLLGASDLSEFSDRLEFMGALAQNDATSRRPPRTPNSRPVGGRRCRYHREEGGPIENRPNERDQDARGKAPPSD